MWTYLVARLTELKGLLLKEGGFMVIVYAAPQNLSTGKNSENRHQINIC